MAAITKSKANWARLLYSISKKPQQNPIFFSRNLSSISLFPPQFQHSPKPVSQFALRPCARFFSAKRDFYESGEFKGRLPEEEEEDDDDESEFFASERTVYDLLAEVEREKQREKAAKRSAGLAVVGDEDDEDYMGVGPLIEKLEKKKIKDAEVDYDYGFEEPTDSDSEEDDERFSEEAIQKQSDEFDRKFKKHEELLKNFVDSETADEAYECMKEIDKFERRNFQLRPEYRVIGELMNHLKDATGKDRFLLIQKLNRAVRLVEWKEAYDPNNPANYGIIQKDDVPDIEDSEKEEEKPVIPGIGMGEVSDEDIAEIKEKDDVLMEKINAIDKKLEQKLAELDCTFGKKGRILEEEIRDLAEERHELTEKNRRPLYRKGFDVRLIDVNRTCKVTKGGQVVKYTALLACGNYHGVIGYAKGKGPAIPIALQKAYEKCFQNLHYVERYEEHTIAHAIQTKYKRTKVYLWPAPTRTGMKAGRTVENILHLAGFKNIKSKVIGSRNPHNTVKAVFKALNAIETPKDVQEKFGRTVVDASLL